MSLRLLISVALAAAAVLAAWMVVGGPQALPARFSLDQCRHVSLRDVGTGRLVRGAADMAMLPDGGTLAIAAIDRGNPRRPFSGLFAVNLFDIEQGTEEVEVDELIPSYGLPGGVRPKGIAFDGTGDRLALINKVGPGTNTVIDVLRRQGDHYRRYERYRHEAYCRGHDLTFDPGGNLLITRDRGRCEPGIADYLPWYATGLVLTLTPEGQLSASEERYMYPAGIAIDPTGVPIVAEMLTGDLSGGGPETTLPGAPDNLTVDDLGALIVAVHPSLWSLILYSNGFAFSSPSRVVRVDPESTGLEVLFDDPAARLISAAGVAVMHEGKLYMSSIYDEGIVVCGEE